jgi:type II secretory pathway component PulF
MSKVKGVLRGKKARMGTLVGIVFGFLAIALTIIIAITSLGEYGSEMDDDYVGANITTHVVEGTLESYSDLLVPLGIVIIAVIILVLIVATLMKLIN